MAELSAPFPPGEYPVLVVGSGPGALQASFSLSRLGVDHARHLRRPVTRRHVPTLAVLPAAAVVDQAARAGQSAGPRAYERYDWNSLLGADPICTAIQPGLMDGTSYFPSRPEMEANLVAFADAGAGRDPLRMPLDRDPPGRRRPTATGSRSRRPTASTASGARRGGRRRGAVHAARCRDGAHGPLCRRPSRRDLRGPPGADHRQAELRLRAGHRAAAVGASARPRLAVEGEAIGRDADAGRASGRATSSRTRTTSWAAG